MEDDLVTNTEMQTRTCQCGCGLAFRCLASSSQKFASQSCQAAVTPGGMAEVMKQTKKKSTMKEIPPDALGVVSSNELAKLLRVTYQTVYLWTKSGRIVPVDPGSHRKQYNLADVRRRLSNGRSAEMAVPTDKIRPLTDARTAQDAPRPMDGNTSGEGARTADSLGGTPERAAFMAFRAALKRKATAVRAAGDSQQELALLRRIIGLDRKRFEQALASL